MIPFKENKKTDRKYLMSILTKEDIKQFWYYLKGSKYKAL